MPDIPGVPVTPPTSPASAPAGPSPLGADLVSPASRGTPVASPPVSPSPVDISDDTLIRIPGQDKPVKYGELYRRLQADHTRKTQEAAKLRREIDTERQQWQERRQQEESRLAAIAASLTQRPDTGATFLNDLAKRPYLDGATAAQIVGAIQKEGFAPLVKAIQDRDTILTSLHQQINELRATVGQFQGRHAETSFDARINAVLADLGLPKEAASLAKEVYLAYEGEDLDAEYPEILRARWDQLQQLFRTNDQRRVEESRRQPFPVPAKGGNGTPGKAIQLTGRESAKEMTDLLWAGLQGHST